MYDSYVKGRKSSGEEKEMIGPTDGDADTAPLGAKRETKLSSKTFV